MSPGLEPMVLHGQSLSKDGEVADWMLGIRLRPIPEITADNSFELLERIEWSVLAIYNHSDLALDRSVHALLEPFARKYEARGNQIAFATARLDLYGHQFN
eukprot:1015602-Amphidinium_carterae.1